MNTTEPIRHVTSEHTTTRLELDASTIAALRAAAPPPKLTITPSTIPGAHELRTGSHVGSVVTDGVQVLVRPKVPMRNMLALLAPDVSPVEIAQLDMHYADDASLLDVIAALYQRTLAAALARGMRRTYVGVDERLIAVRGRIDLPRQMRFATPTPLACHFDEYSLDSPHNRLLKAAITRVVGLEHIGVGTRAALLRTLAWFGDVGDRCPPVGPLLRRGFTRLDEHYRAPVQLAALIVENTSIRDEFGGRATGSFLVDMNAVFETYVTEALRRRLPAPLRVFDQHPAHLNTERTVTIRPDVVVMNGAGTVYVADLKYKVPDDPEGNHGDLYQLLAYATALDLPEGMLIYAGGTGPATPTELTVGPDRRRLAVVRVDLGGSLDQLAAAMDDLAGLLTDGCRRAQSSPIGRSADHPSSADQRSVVAGPS